MLKLNTKSQFFLLFKYLFDDFFIHFDRGDNKTEEEKKVFFLKFITKLNVIIKKFSVMYFTPPIAEILCVKNGRGIVVCGFFMK